MLEPKGTVPPDPAVDIDQCEPPHGGYRVEVHAISDDMVKRDGTSLVVQTLYTDRTLTYPQARELLIAIGRKHPELHQAASPLYLAIAPAHRGGAR